MTHPLLLAYGDTAQKDFPLILVVGREPNRDSLSDKTVGKYDFRCHPTCAFWNIAFKTIGSRHSLSVAEMKNLFERKKSSPVVFTDASPKAIPNRITDKHSIRDTLTDEEITEHIHAIFSNRELISRVRLILLSGIANDIEDMFKERASGVEIPVTSVPFFYGTNYTKITQQIGERDAKIFFEVLEEFISPG